MLQELPQAQIRMHPSTESRAAEPAASKSRASHPVLVVVLWLISRLIPYARNPRLHPGAQIVQITESIREFGFNNPILVTPEGEIIAGEARLLAAARAGMTEVPVIVLSHLTEAQNKAYRLADNRLALYATWDFERLQQELRDLVDQNFPLPLTGFDAGELHEIMKRQPLLPADPDAIPKLQTKPISRLGDTWILGGHILLCGDGTKQEDLKKLLRGDFCSLVFTDLPYFVNYTSKGQNKMKIINDDLGDDCVPFLRAACSAMLAVCQGPVYICMSSQHLHDLYSAFCGAGGHWSTFIVWAKNTFTLGHSDYHRQYEPILYGWPEGVKHYWCGDRDQSDVWQIAKPCRNDVHPTMKPVELVERAIRNSSLTSDVVLDPFAGSGTTLIACENLGRRARLVEIDPQYVDVIVRRWQEFTGGEAFLDGDGRCFEDIARERIAEIEAAQNNA